MFQKFFLFTLKRLIILTIAGIVISVLHSYDLIVLVILALSTVLIYLRRRKLKNLKIYFFGFMISAIGGIIGENWGVQSDLWTYHDLSDNREFPYWLPLAWGLSFSLLYSFEQFYIKTLKLKSLKSKITLTLLVSALLPTIGEIVTVQLGVWTYNSGYKIFGIPLYVIGIHSLFHTGTFLLLYTVNLYWKIPDPVFSTNSFPKLQSEITS